MDMKLKVAEYIAQAAQQSFENCALTGNDVSAMIETPPDKNWPKKLPARKSIMWRLSAAI